MERKRLLIILCCLLFSVSVIGVLYSMSEDLVHKYNSFVRLFPPHFATESIALDLKYNSYYFSGATENHIYLANSTASLHLLKLSTSLTDTQHITLSIRNHDLKNLRFRKNVVDSPYFYLMDGTTPALFGGKIGHWTANRLTYDSAFFVDAVPISNSSFALRSAHITRSKTKEDILGKESLFDKNFKAIPGLLEKQIDGIFCTSGMLHYNKTLDKLIYLYYYRNQYLVMDSSLNLLYKGNTIDTISKVKIKVGEFHSGANRTLSAPPFYVNKNSCVYDRWLFVHSALFSKNELKKTFNKASVIDVYDLVDGTYRISFYLFDYQDRYKVRDILVTKNKIFALFDHYILAYDFDLKRIK